LNRLEVTDDLVERADIASELVRGGHGHNQASGRGGGAGVSPGEICRPLLPAGLVRRCVCCSGRSSPSTPF
jgi:hypothetical protein